MTCAINLKNARIVKKTHFSAKIVPIITDFKRAFELPHSRVDKQRIAHRRVRVKINSFLLSTASSPKISFLHSLANELCHLDFSSSTPFFNVSGPERS